ncbi:MAG TPA: hypothetical protein VJM47_01335 [Nitrosospira sp.]|nr:hypothetical protein [Nitrosospira sp.]
MRKYNRHVPCLIFERRENQAVEFESKEPLNKSSAERVAVKIGMITRRATKVVAWTYDAKERNEVTLQSVTRGTREAGSGSVECHDRGPACSVSASIPLRGRIFLRKTPLLSPRSPPDFAATRMEQALQAICFVRLLAKGVNRLRRRLSRISSPKAAVAPAGELFSGS